MFTKTITLSGDALSSFLAAGGQTVNPNAVATAAAAAAAAVEPTTSAVAQVAFPTVVQTTSAAAAVAAVATPTSRAGFVANMVTTTTTTTSMAPTTTSVAPITMSVVAKITTSSLPPTTSSIAVATTSSAIQSSSIATTTSSAAKVTTKAATSSARVSSVRSAAVNALSSSKTKTGSSGIGGGGIAGIIIGLLILFGIAGALFFFWRKRRNERREEEYAEKSRRDARNEKGMVRLEEEEISTPTGGGGFDFGHLPQIASNPPPVVTDNSTFARSASPAQMQQGAAILGIQRPFTPPPGHPAHPNYRQPPALVASRQAQHQQQQQLAPQGVRNITPNMPRKPVQANMATVQRKLSSNNPFNDPPASTDIAPPLARAVSPPPARVSSPPVIPMPTTINPVDPRASVASFTAGDDSAHEEDDVVAPLNDAVSPKSLSPKQASMPFASIAATEAAAPAASQQEQPQPQPKEDHKSDATAQDDDDSVVRSKSVQRASDNWAARKAHLKNTLALQSASNPTSPTSEQSPFADPAPTIDHEIAVVSPMQMNFDRDSQKF